MIRRLTNVKRQCALVFMTNFLKSDWIWISVTNTRRIQNLLMQYVNIPNEIENMDGNYAQGTKIN